nr:sucrase/ferredoxin-like family protein [Tanacetum cinerariifolium]
ITETSNGDVLIFLDMIRYRRLTHFDVDTFVEVLVKDDSHGKVTGHWYGYVMPNDQISSDTTPHKVCTARTWLETWESEDVYAALALIGAAVSVAVAYNCYRQLG